MNTTAEELDSPITSDEFPQRIELPVRDGVTPCGKSPVRIFLGTEPAQYRAERVFLWSIEQVRDPSRRYYIYIMKNLPGFDSRRWLTGFTNYRFAIPHFAGGEGRAIYNDVDQVYLEDPAQLFDLDLGEHGYLAISPRDTSVMLMDCAQMIRHGVREITCPQDRIRKVFIVVINANGPIDRLRRFIRGRELSYF